MYENGQELKKLLLILLFYAGSYLPAQSYIQMLKYNSEWSVTNCYFGCITDNYITVGDTIIGAYHYKFLDYYHYGRNFALREDTIEQKVYLLFLGGGPGPKPPGDQLLYDFKMQVGDSMDVVNPNSPGPSSAGKFVLDSIKLRPLVNKNYRYFYLRSLDTIQSGVRNTVWVEGIGSLCLINTPGEPPNISGIGQLSCFFSNGIKEYEDLDSISSCQPQYPISVNELFRAGNSITVKPNPADQFINILAEGYEGSAVEIINVLGGTEAELNYSPSLDISFLSPGMYFVRFKRNDISYTLKFVKN